MKTLSTRQDVMEDTHEIHAFSNRTWKAHLDLNQSVLEGYLNNSSDPFGRSRLAN